MARPISKIDWKMVDKFFEMYCTGAEVASRLGIAPGTLSKYIEKEKGVLMSDYMQTKREKGHILLREAQLKTALKGNVTMQIWLGKNMLGQKDELKIEQKFDGTLGSALDVFLTSKTPEELEKKRKKREKCRN